jgi:hypothetical protein
VFPLIGFKITELPVPSSIFPTFLRTRYRFNFSLLLLNKYNLGLFISYSIIMPANTNDDSRDSNSNEPKLQSLFPSQIGILPSQLPHNFPNSTVAPIPSPQSSPSPPLKPHQPPLPSRPNLRPRPSERIKLPILPPPLLPFIPPGQIQLLNPHYYPLRHPGISPKRRLKAGLPTSLDSSTGKRKAGNSGQIRSGFPLKRRLIMIHGRSNGLPKTD